MRSSGWIGGVLVLLGCGPRPIALDDGDASTAATTASTASTSSTEGPEPETDTDSDDWSAGFVPDDDLWSALDDCSVFEQDCPEAYKCVPSIGADSSPSHCVPVLGTHGVGEPCEFESLDGTDDCDANSHCWPDYDDEPPYTDVCRPLCEGTPDDPACPGRGESCTSYACHILGQVGIPLCQLDCDPLAQACGEGQACKYFYPYFGCGVVASEPNPSGAVCDWNWDSCAPGLICAAAEQLPACDGPSCCTPYCGLGDEPTCAELMPGTVCVELSVSDPIEGCPGYGMCALP